MYVVLKGFRSQAEQAEAERLFGGFACGFIHCDDTSFDIGAYRDACAEIAEDHVLFFNTNSEIVGENWLAKYLVNYDDRVGLAGATGSLEALVIEGRVRAPFPNPHVRSNAFLIAKTLFLDIVAHRPTVTKTDLYDLEAGRLSLTQEVRRRGLRVVLIGRNGRAYSPPWWPMSETFRQGDQGNLMVRDNQTELFASSIWTSKRLLASNAWGRYLDPLVGGRLPSETPSRAPLTGQRRDAKA